MAGHQAQPGLGTNGLLEILRMLQAQRAAQATQQDREAAERDRQQQNQFMNDMRMQTQQGADEQRSLALYNVMQRQYSEMLKSLDSGDQRTYTQNLERLKALAGTLGKGQHVNQAKLAQGMADLQNVENLYTAQGKAWTPQTLDSDLAPYMAKTSPYAGPLHNSVAVQYLQQLVTDPTKAAQAKAAAQQALQGQADESGGIMQGLQNEMYHLDPTKHSQPELREKLTAFLSAPPEQMLARIQAMGGGVQSPAAQGHAPSIMDALAQGNIDNAQKTLGRPLGDLGPMTAGTIKGAHGTYAVPIAGAPNGSQEQTELFNAFDAFNKGGTPPGVAQQRVAAPPPVEVSHDVGVAPPRPVAAPKDQFPTAFGLPRAPAQGGSLLDIVQGTPDPNPAKKPLFGAKDLQHAIAADGQWNGPRSDEIREKVKGMPLDQVKEKVAFHALRTGIPFEHLWDAGVRGGFIGGGDDAG